MSPTSCLEGSGEGSEVAYNRALFRWLAGPYPVKGAFAASIF